ncbi:MAG: hypothetical protein AAF685_02610 [Cyanobacteria bacterium P01_C01_bin.89]
MTIGVFLLRAKICQGKYWVYPGSNLRLCPPILSISSPLLRDWGGLVKLFAIDDRPDVDR